MISNGGLMMAKSIPITINGITYPSIIQAAMALEMPQDTLYYRLKYWKLTPDDVANLPRRKYSYKHRPTAQFCKRWLFDGQKYTTAEAVAHLGISSYQLRLWFSDTEHDLIGTKQRGK
jgi:hypothetical protein